MKFGIIDVGGGLRGIYGAGVLDRCMEEGIRFDCCIGVSAGSANMSSYVAGQHGRNKPFYLDYSFRKEYMSVSNLVRKHSYLDLDYVYGALSNSDGENPLDYPAVVNSPAELVVVATDARTGKPVYFTKEAIHQNDYRILMASCCIPVIDRPYYIEGVPYYDGGLANPVPLEKAKALGCDHLAVILTKPIAPEQTGSRDKKLARLLRRHYPEAAKGLELRAERYNSEVRKALKMEQAGTACVIAPDSTEGMSTLTKDKQSLETMYRKGHQDAEKLVQWYRSARAGSSVD